MIINLLLYLHLLDVSYLSEFNKCLTYILFTCLQCRNRIKANQNKHCVPITEIWRWTNFIVLWVCSSWNYYPAFLFLWKIIHVHVFTSRGKPPTLIANMLNSFSRWLRKCCSKFCQGRDIHNIEITNLNYLICRYHLPNNKMRLIFCLPLHHPFSFDHKLNTEQ